MDETKVLKTSSSKGVECSLCCTDAWFSGPQSTYLQPNRGFSLQKHRNPYDGIITSHVGMLPRLGLPGPRDVLFLRG